MPNHVQNELIFEGVDEAEIARIKAAVCNAQGVVDFEILLPPPLNAWPGSASSLHEKAFPDTELNWCTKNWSTKWNAYQLRDPIIDGGRLIFRFQTAWSAPNGWLCAVFKTLQRGFVHHWLDEGRDEARTQTWDWVKLTTNFGLGAWEECIAAPEITEHLGRLHWGDAYDDIVRERAEGEDDGLGPDNGRSLGEIAKS